MPGLGSQLLSVPLVHNEPLYAKMSPPLAFLTPTKPPLSPLFVSSLMAVGVSVHAWNNARLPRK